MTDIPDSHKPCGVWGTMQDRSAQRLALLYIAIAGLWIFFSTIIGLGFDLAELEGALFELIKGLTFVLVTGSILYLYARRQNELELTSKDALTESEERYRELLANFGAIILLFDQDTHEIRDVNDTACSFYGYDYEEFCGKHVTELFADDSSIPPLGQNHRNLRSRHKLKSGAEREVELFCSLLSLPTDKRMLCIVNDVTEREAAREQLRLESERFALAISTMKGAVWEWDGKSDDMALSPRHYEMLGEPIGAFPPKMSYLVERIHPEDRPLVIAVRAGFLAGQADEFDLTFRVRHAAGHWIWLRTRGRRIHTNDFSSQRVIAVDEEVTERKFIEQQAQLSKVLIEKSPAILFRWSNKEGWPVNFVTRNIERLGFCPEDFLENQRDYASIIHPDDLADVKAHWNSFVGSGQSEFTMDYRLIKKDGTIVWVSESTNLIKDENGDIIELQGTIIDITKRKLQGISLELAAALDSAVINDEPLDDILATFCDNTARLYDLSLAWIGAKQADGSVTCRAAQGAAAGYVQGINVRWDDTPEGNGPGGRAIRTGEVQRHNIDSPEFAPWHKRATPFGLQCSAVIPLATGQEVVGFLAVYASHPQGISDLHIQLLSDVGRNLAIAWKSADHRKMLLRQDAALSSTVNGVVVTDRKGDVAWANHAFEQITGYEAKELIGQNLRLLKSGKHDKRFYQDLWSHLLRGETFSADFTNKRKDGSLYQSRQTLMPLYNNHQEIVSFVGIQEDVSAREAAEKRVEHLTAHDPLTGLPNRVSFNNAMAHAISSATDSGHSLAVLYFDLDRFKIINDAMGHSTGDRLLQSVSRRIRQVMREGDLLARVGGDEFAIVQNGVESDDDAMRLARRIISELSEPINLDDREINASVSIGITLYPRDGTTPEQLLSNADLAMYKAKYEGRNTFRFYSPTMHANAQSRATLESDLRRAVKQGEFEVFYQPQVRLQDGALAGMESLVRWRYPDGTLRMPGTFITAAEDIGVISQLGQFVLSECCTLGRKWIDEGICPERLSVNLSFAQFQNQDLVAIIRRTLTQTGFPPERLELELTESILAKYPEDAVIITRRLHALGIQLAIDDFGTGYSSLRYLREFPVSRLKIDQSFVRDLSADDKNNSIVQAAVDLGHNLGLQVIAEGVETNEQAAILQSLGCDEIQGFLCAKALPVAEIETLLRAPVFPDLMGAPYGFP
ncbi:MAG: EAL domain-containing protein [Chrysiogenetes bacterium]|nr:EAL domain-containing protein [Chrysiogenetes bacterium]